MTLRATQVKVALAERGRREDLRIFADPLAFDFRAPGEFSVAGLDRVQVFALSVHHLAVAISRARTLIRPRADYGADAYVQVGFSKFCRRRRAAEPDRGVEFANCWGVHRHAAAAVRPQITSLLFRQHFAVALFAFFEVESLQTFIFLTVFHLLGRCQDVAVGHEWRARARILFLPNDCAGRSVEAKRYPVETGEEYLVAGNYRGRDHVGGDLLLPQMASRLQIGAQHPVSRAKIRRIRVRAALSSGIGDVKPAFGDRGLAHQRVAQPFLPDHLSGLRLCDNHGAAFSVESDVTV